ncbi:hypothetical protein ANN_19648 [Periplaneta americana]|uniref:Uncharacterized protein n=1 Tax=Periplaneta americana TaxID=6978 RepID=A0ABQ8SBD0_PERAM|nr:hypothetical protein ANN_19648 [Periplaneta americana]
MSPGPNTESYPTFARIGLKDKPGTTSTRQDFILRAEIDTNEYKKILTESTVENVGGLIERKRSTSRKTSSLSITNSITIWQESPEWKTSTLSHRAVDQTDSNPNFCVFNYDISSFHQALPVPFDLLFSTTAIRFILVGYSLSRRKPSDKSFPPPRSFTKGRLRWARHVARMGESRKAYRVLVGRPEGKRPLRLPRRRWEDNIEMDLREVGYDDTDWINLAQDRDRWRAYVRATMNLRFP